MVLSKETPKYTSTFRGYDLTKIRDLVILIDRDDLRSRRALRDYAIGEGIFKTKISRLGRHAGESYKKSGTYHYESLLFSLGIVEKEFSGDEISLSEAGRRLARIAGEKDEYRSEELSDELKREFSLILVGNEVFKKEFLSRFFADEAFEKYNSLAEYEILRLFRSQGDPIFIQPDERDRCFKVNGGTFNSVDECREFRGMVNFAKQAGMVEEITVLESHKFNIELERSHIVFPIMDSDDLRKVRLSDFKRWIDEQIDSQNGRVRRLALPELMYKTCSTKGLDKVTFKKLLKELNRSDPIQYRLEKASTAFIDERYHQLDNYLKVKGIYRGSLAVMR